MMINKESTILEILLEYPEAKEILLEHDLGCSKCLGAAYENLEIIAKTNNVDLEELLTELKDLENG